MSYLLRTAACGYDCRVSKNKNKTNQRKKRIRSRSRWKENPFFSFFFRFSLREPISEKLGQFRPPFFPAPSRPFAVHDAGEQQKPNGNKKKRIAPVLFVLFHDGAAHCDSVEWGNVFGRRASPVPNRPFGRDVEKKLVCFFFFFFLFLAVRNKKMPRARPSIGARATQTTSGANKMAEIEKKKQQNFFVGENREKKGKKKEAGVNYKVGPLLWRSMATAAAAIFRNRYATEADREKREKKTQWTRDEPQ